MLFKDFISNYMYTCVFVCGYLHLNAVTHRSQERAFHPQELESESVVSRMVSVLGAELASSGEEQALITTEPSLQLHQVLFKRSLNGGILHGWTMKNVAIK